MQVINTQPLFIRIVRDYKIKILRFTIQTNMIERKYTTCIKIHVITVNLEYKNYVQFTLIGHFADVIKPYSQ